jgi:hypothetical protein
MYKNYAARNRTALDSEKPSGTGIPATIAA